MKTKKKLSAFCSLLAGAFILFAFASCADVASSKETGSVSFTFGQDFVERIAAAARAAENSDDAGDSSSEIESKTVFEVQIAIRGDYSATKTISFEYNRPDSEKHNESVAEANYSTQNLTISSFELNSSDRGSYSNVPSQTLTFDNIPEGASVYAVGLVQVIDSYNYSGESFSSKYLAFIGVSENAKISAGQATSLPLLMKNAYFSDEIAYGKSSGYDADFVLSLSPNQDEQTGYWRVTYNYNLISAGKYTVLEFDKSETTGEKLPKRIAVTECIYVPESDVKKINDFYKAVTEGTGYSSHESSYSYQIASSARTSEINAGDGGHFSFTSLNGITVSFGIFPTYTLTISDNEGTLYTDSGDWMRSDTYEYLTNFNAAMKAALEKLGFQYVTTGDAYKNGGAITGLTYTVYGEASESEIGDAFFPKGYEPSNVKAWFGNFNEESLENESGASDSAGYQSKSFALYLFDDGTILATKLKIKESEGERKVERKIERAGTYTLNTADDFDKNSGTATFTVDGKTETYKFGIFNDAFLAYAAEDYSTEGYGIMTYVRRSNEDIPEPIDPDEDSGSSGDLSVENNLLEISISDTSVAMNGSLTFSAKDTDENDVTNDVSFNAQLLYKGTDVNDLAPVSSAYYIITDNKLTLSNPLPKAGTYQLYVTATWTGVNTVTSSQTFEITVKDEYVTPETHIALYTYGYDNSVSAYKTSYYLTNDSDVSEVTVGGTADLTAVTSTNSAFDAFGNFYALTNADSKAQVIVYSSASGTSTTIELEDLSSYDAAMRGFTIDIAKNTAYGYQKNGSALALFKYPSLITEGTVSDVVSYDTSLSLYETKKLAICNNKLYVLGYDSSAWNILVYDISSGLSINSSVLYSCVLDSILPESLSYAKFDSSNYNGYYGDMYANDDVVYILVKPFTKWTSDNPNIYGGAVLKWVPGESSVSVLGLAEKAISQETITQMYLYKTDGYESPVYADENGATVKTMLADSTSYTAGTDNATYARTDGYKFFPNVYAVSSVEDDSAFAGPARIIGLKPKKLVIADDGYAFYTDSLGALCVKNANRVVTIDLEEFVIDSINTTPATFDSELTSFLLSSVSINTVRNIGTYYDYNASAWYFDSSERSYKTYSIGFGNSVYLSVKNEE